MFVKLEGQSKIYLQKDEFEVIDANATDLIVGCDQRSFLFDDETVEYPWNYDNHGLRVAQVYFLEIPQQIGLDP